MPDLFTKQCCIIIVSVWLFKSRWLGNKSPVSIYSSVLCPSMGGVQMSHILNTLTIAISSLVCICVLFQLYIYIKYMP